MEGFFEATAQDIASFNIQTTLVEPGGARTEFGFRSLVQGTPISAYEDTPVVARRRIRAAGQYKRVGDAAKMVRAMIASVDQEPAPKRLTLGSDAYTLMHQALTERRAALEAQRDLAFSTDATD
jgi:NAD(P)-dependent dehydrogenase (short-subunit alcohol dehydrogenase family)